jgi:AraC-like DNA-binding protein
MSFQPAMTSVREGVLLLDDLRCRAWSGAIADLWHAECEAGAQGHYLSPHPRLFVVLQAEGGPFETRLTPNGPAARGLLGTGSLNYIPADQPIWGHVVERLRIRHLDVHFDPDEIATRLGERIPPRQLAKPRLAFEDSRIFALAGMLAEDCANSSARHDLYGDGLVLALLIALFDIGRSSARRRPGLAPWQLQRVTDYLGAHCEKPIRLQSLAEMVGLSASYFSHAFKAATGVPPHRWQIQARVRKGQDLLRDGHRSLPEIAAETGFSDQAHFTRAFRRIVGETPAAWQKLERGATDALLGARATTR